MKITNRISSRTKRIIFHTPLASSIWQNLTSNKPRIYSVTISIDNFVSYTADIGDNVTKTRLNIHFFPLFLLKNIDCGYFLVPPHRGVLTITHNLWFEQEYEKYQIFLYENFLFLVVKISLFLNRRAFVFFFFFFFFFFYNGDKNLHFSYIWKRETMNLLTCVPTKESNQAGNSHSMTLRKQAYSNILKFLPPRNEKFQIKILIFSYFCSKHRSWVLVRTASANLCFWAEIIIKKHVNPWKPKFYYNKGRVEQRTPLFWGPYLYKREGGTKNPFVLGSMSVGLNILIRHSFMDLWFWITALVPWPQLLKRVRII